MPTLSTLDGSDYDDVNLPDDEATLLARIPLMAGSNRKAAYLAFRATGFTVGKSAELAGVTKQTVNNWRKNDDVFKMWEQEKLQELQSSVGNDVIKFDFLRNMRYLLQQDMTLIAKAMSEGLEELTPREYEVYKGLRKFYTPSDWLALEKVLAPEKHQANNTFVVNLSWGNRLDPSLVIEGESKEILDEPEPKPQLAAAQDSDLFAM